MERGALMGNLFSNKKSTQQATTSNQAGSTQNNLWDNPGLQTFLQGYNNQFQNAGNFNVATDPNITGAAAAQSGVAGGLQPAFQTANNVGSEGITTGNIQKYMSPYTQQVVDATAKVQNLQNQQGLSALGGNMAAKSALGNNVGTSAAYLAGVAPAQNAALAGLYQAGYGQASNTAAQDAQLRLQGASTAGSLTGAATGANTAWGNLGQYGQTQANFNATTPYSLYNQGVQGFTGLGGLAGQNYTGNSNGTSNGTSAETPSLGSVLFGLLGTGISAYKADGGPVNDNVPITPYRPSDAPQETMIDKVIKASHALREFRDGGTAGMANGGMPDGYNPTWNTKVDAPSSGPNYGKAGSGLSSMGSNLGKMSNDGDMGGNAIAAQQAELSRGLQSIMQRPAFADGGDADRGVSDAMRPFMPSAYSPVAGLPALEPVNARPVPSVMGQEYRAEPTPPPAYVGAAPRTASPEAKSTGSTFYDMIGRPFSGGVWDGKEATAGQRAGAALTQIGNGPFAGFGQHILAQQKMRYDELAAERAAAELMGQYRGQDTLAKQQVLGAVDGKPTVAARTVGIHEAMLPSDLRLKAAQAGQAEVASDKAYNLQLAQIPGMQKEMGLIDDMEVSKGYSKDPAKNAQIANEMRQRITARYQRGAETATAVQRSGPTPTATRPANAKLAPDGNYYVWDANTGKHLRWEE
jgi:hypothetical protein